LRLRSLVLLLTLVFSGVLPTAASRTVPSSQLFQAATSVARTSKPIEIPFDLVNRHIIMKVKVGDSRPLSFVLDTGDKYSVISLDRAKELGLKLKGEVQMGGAGANMAQGAFIEDSSFTIPGLSGFSQPLSLALPIGRMASGLGHDFDGLLGFDFIKEFVVEIDYQARVLRLHDKGKFIYSGLGEAIPIDLKMRHATGHPILEAEVTPNGGSPLKGKYVLDLGAGLALALYSPFVNRHQLLSTSPQHIKAFGAGAGGEIQGRVGRVAELKIGKFRISEPVTLFSQDTAGAFADSELAGNIGMQIASKFKLFLDYGRSRIILEPAASFPEPFDRASAGARVHAEGPGYRTFRVKNVLDNSPASEAGLQPDDIISAIDGKPATDFTLTKLIEMFERPVSYKLTVRRGEQILNVTLTPRRLV